MLNRYLNVLIIEVRLKSQQQRDPCRWVCYSLSHCTLQPRSEARIYFFSCCLSPPWRVLVVKVDSDIQRGVCKFICDKHLKHVLHFCFVLFFLSRSPLVMRRAVRFGTDKCQLAFAIQLTHQSRELSVVFYHCHISNTGLFVRSFIYTLPACFCLPPDVPPPLLLRLFLSSCFSCLLNRDMLIWGPLAWPQGNKSLVLLISCKIRHVHSSPVYTPVTDHAV